MAWPTAKLGDVFQTGSGGTPLRSKSEYYEDGTIPWLMSGEVGQGEIHSVGKCITELGLANSAAKIFPAETVVVAMYGATAGQVGLLKCDAATNQAVCGILPNSRFSPKFLYYYLLSRQSHMIAQATGNAQPNISQVKIRNIDVPLAPLPEQRRIVAVLDEAFAGLEAMRANAEKNLQNARELFESHIRGVFRHRGDEWTLASIGDIGDCCLGKMLDKAKNKGLPKPYLRNLNVRWFEFALDDLLEMKFEESEIERYSARKGDLLICEGGYPGRAAIWQADEPIFFQKAIHRVRFDDPKKAKILLYFLYCQDRSGELKLHFTGAGIQHFTGQALRRLQIPLPPSNQIDDVIQMFDRLREETERLEGLYREKLVAIDELKQSILQKAFSGELTSSKAIAA